jgi:hypothetical protein
MGSLGRLSEDIRLRLRNSFVKRCLRIAIDGYNFMREAQEYSLDWEEESLTANLISHMKRSPEVERGKIDIIPESHLYSEDIELGKVLPKEASRIDIMMSSWTTPEKLVYYIEAKNLCQKDWQKPNGSKVNASKYRVRYVDTGIENFIIERYPEGCLAGYVLQGEIEPIVKSINRLLEKNRERSSEILENQETIHKHPYCYTSYHKTKSGKEMNLKHLFMKLN